MELYQKLEENFSFLPNQLSKLPLKDHDESSNYAYSYYNNHYFDHHQLNPFNGSTSFNPQNIGFNPLTTIETSSKNAFFGVNPTTCNTRFHLDSLASDYHHGASDTNHLNGYGGVFLDTDQDIPRSSLNHPLRFQQNQDQTHLFSSFKIEVFQLNNSKAPTDEISCITTNEYDQFQNNKKVVEANGDKKVDKKNRTIKGQWTTEEDRMLKKMVRKHGEKKWSQIAKLLPGRIGKQCRDRWHNHLRPNIRKDAWCEEEDRILIEAHKEIGNRWTEIAKRLPGRTENNIKNHWNATKRRLFSKRNYNSTNALLQNYMKSFIGPSATHVQATNNKEETSEVLGLHSQMESFEELKALMSFDYDESKYTLDSTFFSDGNCGFVSSLHQELPCGTAVEETQMRDLDM